MGADLEPPRGKTSVGRRTWAALLGGVFFGVVLCALVWIGLQALFSTGGC